MRGSGDSRHIVHGAAAVVHVREHQHRHLRAKRLLHAIGLHQLQAATMALAQGLGNIQIGWEVAALANDNPPRRVRMLRNANGRRQHLEQIHRGAIRRHHFVSAGTDQGGDACAQALGQVKPTCRVPGPNQPLPPLLLHHLRRPRCGGHRQHTERIAIEVNRVRRNTEMRAQRAQGVIRVKLAAVVQSGHVKDWLKVIF